ncbi:mitotic spindle assembly checkpoint protein MAD2B-like protein isoform X1 [Tanacetum coccineum]
MDYSVPQSQISASSTSNPAMDAQSSSGINPSEFVNRGLLLWNQTRQQWTENKASADNEKARQPVIRSSFVEEIEWDSVSLLSSHHLLNPSPSFLVQGLHSLSSASMNGYLTLSWNATYDNLLGTNKPFSRPIPLPEMVNFLVDIWEQEGFLKKLDCIEEDEVDDVVEMMKESTTFGWIVSKKMKWMM